LEERTHDISMGVSIHHRAATAQDLTRILAFLKNNDLPTAGVPEFLENFVIAEDQNGTWVGIAGFEHYGENCLLRSVAVDERFRTQGHGTGLVDEVLRNARAKGAKKVYLLTDDAGDYFKRLGFKVVDRADVEETVKFSPEFTVCRQSALTMRKDI
jgi:N-acetylglutamate synthase-like GNAT family acetyltransferase